MPTLFARRYMRKVKHVGPIEKVLGVLIVLLLAGILVAFVIHAVTNQDYLFNVDETAYAPSAPEATSAEPETATASTNESAGPFPDPGLESWRAPKQVDRFDPDNLYIEIDGQAPAYVEFGFVELMRGTYDYEGDAERMVDVYVYDMGAPDNALRMYSVEEPAEKTLVGIGTAGYQVGGAVFFCQGSYYVQVMPSTLDDADARAALQIAELVAAQIE